MIHCIVKANLKRKEGIYYKDTGVGIQLGLRKELESYQGLGIFLLLICFILLSLKFSFPCFLVYLLKRKRLPYNLLVLFSSFEELA